MNKGFELYIQKNLTQDERIMGENYLREFLVKTCADPKMRYFGVTGGGYTTGMWRGRFGISLGDTLVFRRIAKNARRFAVIQINTLEVFNDKYLDKHNPMYRDLSPDGEIPTDKCRCPRHKGSIRVRFKQKPELELFALVGQAKG